MQGVEPRNLKMHEVYDLPEGRAEAVINASNAYLRAVLSGDLAEIEKACKFWEKVAGPATIGEK